MKHPLSTLPARHRLLTVAVCAASLLSAGSPSPAQDLPRTATTRETVEQILGLAEELSRLLATLPAAERREVESRIQATLSSAPTRPDAATQPTADAQPPDRVTNSAAAAEPAKSPSRETNSAAAAEPKKIPAPENNSAAAAEPPKALPQTSTEEPKAPAAALPGESSETLLKAPAARATCNTLDLFDTNADGVLSGADRNWRHFYLWNDANGNDIAEAAEMTNLFDAGVRSVRLDLRRFDAVGDRSGEIEQGRYLILRAPAARKRKFPSSGRLTIDAEDLGRSGGPTLRGSSGEPLNGLQPFVAGLTVELNGRMVKVNCPES